MKKITKATFKSFINKNRDKLLVGRLSSFDGMVDCVVSGESVFKPAENAGFYDNTLGINGVWLVHGSGNLFERYEKNGLVGIRLYNCCGSSVVAVRAGEEK